MGQFTKATEDLDTMLKANPDDGKVIVKKGDLLMMQERYDEALHIYNSAKECSEPPANLREKLREAQLEIKKAKRKDYYKILGVDKNAADGTIKKAYKVAAIKNHPDKHSGKSQEDIDAAEAQFKEIGEAYGVLGDEKKKQMYDQGADIEEINQAG
jgi:DnaJ homolog subfamily C member 7